MAGRAEASCLLPLLLGLIRATLTAQVAPAGNEPKPIEKTDMDDDDDNSLASHTLWCDVGPFVAVVILCSIIGACCIQCAKCFLESFCKNRKNKMDLESARSNVTYLDEVRYRPQAPRQSHHHHQQPPQKPHRRPDRPDEVEEGAAASGRVGRNKSHKNGGGEASGEQRQQPEVQQQHPKQEQQQQRKKEKDGKKKRHRHRHQKEKDSSQKQDELKPPVSHKNGERVNTPLPQDAPQICTVEVHGQTTTSQTITLLDHIESSHLQSHTSLNSLYEERKTREKEEEGKQAENVV